VKYLRAVQFFLGTLAIYLVPPLAGWGVDDLSGFFSLNSRAGYAALIILLGFVAGYQAINAPEGLRGGKGNEGKLVRRQSIVKVVVILLMYGALVFLPFADRRDIGVMFENQAMRWAGLVLAGLGFALIFWSGIALGRFYSADVTVQKNHRLITTGPYRHIRHPRYLGAFLVAIGLFLLFRSWIGLAASIVFLGVLLFRIKDEEALLHREFGQAWEAYCRRSWRFIPYLY
jgi:protein-S-isoprenylcysteine O-methyltransferase Ste14